MADQHGVVSVVAGIAAQNTLWNLIFSVSSLLLYRPFKLGDRLQVMTPAGLETGVVETLKPRVYDASNRRQPQNRDPQQRDGEPDQHQHFAAGRRTASIVTVNLGYKADIDKACDSH